MQIYFSYFAIRIENNMKEISYSINNIKSDGENEIILYQPDSTLSLDVRVENETVWLTQAQMTELFQTTRNNITLHIRNIFKEGELEESSVCKESLLTAADGKRYKTKIYSLDVIISVGYRVKSVRGTQFRIWANKVLKDYLLRGYIVNQRLLYMEKRIDGRLLEHEKRLDDLTNKVDFFIRTSLPPKEGVFFNGQIFDAHEFICRLIKSANKRIILIDNYVDESVLVQLDNRNANVSALIYTAEISRPFRQSIERHNRQYTPIKIKTANRIHDRFLIIDNTLYHIGASIKDLGKKLFAFSRMETSPDIILNNL